MKIVISLMMLSVIFEIRGYPYPIFSSSGDVDTWSYGDATLGGIVLSRYHDPHYNRRTVMAGPTTYPLRQPDEELIQQYNQADRRRQALLEVNDTPSQENEVLYPQVPQNSPVVPIDATDLIQPVEKAEIVPTTTTKAVTIPELDPKNVEISEEPAQEPKTAVNKKKQPKRPVDEDDDEDDGYPNQPRFPTGAFFPMFFGWSGGNGPTAIANAFSTGRGAAAASEAKAYGTISALGKV